jgi:hypothetical protein
VCQCVLPPGAKPIAIDKYIISCTDHPVNFGNPEYFRPCKEWAMGWRKEESCAIQLLAGDRIILLSKASAQPAGHAHSLIQ